MLRPSTDPESLNFLEMLSDIPEQRKKLRCAPYQGTVLRATGQPILNLADASGLTPEFQRDFITTANALNAEHLASRPGYSELQARIASYELAFQLQTTAPEALDLTQESDKTKELYGLNEPKPAHPLALGPAPFGRQ